MGLDRQEEAATHLAGREQGRLQLLAPPDPDAGGASCAPIVLAFFGLGSVLVLTFVGLVAPLIDDESDTDVDAVARTWVAATVAALLVLAYVVARRCWLLQRTPTIPVGAALGGRCEVTGTVEAIEPTTSWFTGQPCVWWRAALHHGYGKRQRKVWEAEAGADRCTLVGDDRSRLTVVLRGPLSWRRDLAHIKDGALHGIEAGLLVGDRLLVLGHVEVVDGERVLTATRATHRGQAAEISKLRWWSRVEVVLAAAGVAYLAAVEVDREELAFRSSPGLWAAAGAAAVLVGALLIAWVGDRRANRGFDLGSPVS